MARKCPGVPPNKNRYMATWPVSVVVCLPINANTSCYGMAWPWRGLAMAWTYIAALDPGAVPRVPDAAPLVAKTWSGQAMAR